MSRIPSLNDDPKYANLIFELRTLHGVIRKRDYNNPADMILMKDDLGELRLGANLLFSFLNTYIDILSELEQEYAEKRQSIYDSCIIEDMSPNMSDTHARNSTRNIEAKVKLIENRINQIKNEYERYNGIAIYLQSRMKDVNTERMIG